MSDDLPAEPAWFITIRMDAETYDLTVDTGAFDTMQAFSVLTAVCSELADRLPDVSLVGDEEEEVDE